MPTPTSATAPSPRRPASAASPWAGRRRSFSSSAARRPMRSSTRGSCTRSRSARARPTGGPRSTSAGRRPESTCAWSCRRASSRRSTPAWRTASPASVRSARASSSRRANASTARSRLSCERALTTPLARRRAAPEPMTTRSIGARIPRNEDPRLLQGLGCFVDDVNPPGALHAASLRSPHAHARIAQIDATAARRVPGVHLVLTAADLGELNQPAPLLIPHPTLTHGRTQRPLAVDEVRYVGEVVAFVVADSRYIAEDAQALIEVDYEPLPVVTDLRSALSPGTPRDPGSARAHHARSPGEVDSRPPRASHRGQPGTRPAARRRGGVRRDRTNPGSERSLRP